MFDFVEEFCKIIIVHRNFVKINYWGKKITRQPQQTTKKLAEKVANLLGIMDLVSQSYLKKINRFEQLGYRQN